jgi:hypothetical protein
LPALKRYIIFNCLLLYFGVHTARALARLARATTTSATYKLKVLDSYSQLAAFGTILCLPAIECQASFDKQGISPLTILVDNLGSLSEHPAIHKARFFPLIAVLACPLAISRHPEINYCRLVRRI